MSTKSKLLAMTENLQLPEDPRVVAEAAVIMPGPTPTEGQPTGNAQQPQPKFPPVATGGAPRTGPGQMLQFRGQMLAVEGELGKLRDRLKEHEGSTPTRRLDPQVVVPSRWANRHPDSFSTAEFARLKQDIELAGGNVQPISVRVLNDQPGRYEIVFGHRRHRACSELGIPVLATIDTSAVSDHELFSAMDRENRERADLSPGWSYFSCRLVRFRLTPISMRVPGRLHPLGMTGRPPGRHPWRYIDHPTCRRPMPCPPSPCASSARRPYRFA